MHTSGVLTANDFAVSVDDRPTSFADAVGGFSLDDRLAVVIAQDGGALDAAATILAAVTEFYAQLSERESGYWAYPDVYALHLDRLRGYHAHLDIWPEHKEVVVPAAGERLLCALNDRRVTHVLLPDGPIGHGAVLRESVDRSRRQVRTVLQYGVPDGEITIAGGGAAAEMCRRTRRACAGLLDPDSDPERVVDCLRRVEAEELPGRLLGLAEDPADVGLSNDYRDRHGVDARVLGAHVVTL